MTMSASRADEPAAARCAPTFVAGAAACVESLLTIDTWWPPLTSRDASAVPMLPEPTITIFMSILLDGAAAFGAASAMDRTILIAGQKINSQSIDTLDTFR